MATLATCAAARISRERGAARSKAISDGRARKMLPRVFFLCVGDGMARGVLLAGTAPGVAAVGTVRGVIGPGVGGLVGALALGADNDETTRIPTISSAVSSTTVAAARRNPRRGFGVGRMPKTTLSCP